MYFVDWFGVCCKVFNSYSFKNNNYVGCYSVFYIWYFGYV